MYALLCLVNIVAITNLADSYLSSKPIFVIKKSFLNAATTERPERSYIVETFAQPQNLKTAPGIVSKWKQTVSDLSEIELIKNSEESKNEVSIERTDKAMYLAYNRCEYVTKLFSKTFYVGTSLMRPDARKHVWAIYAWCRRTDDIVDSPRALLNRDVLKSDLEVWSNRLDDIWKDHPVDLFDLAMSDTVKKFPNMDIQPYQDMIEGMVMDVPGLGQERYKNFDELYLYCYRVAGTVGLMTLPILGVLVLYH